MERGKKIKILSGAMGALLLFSIAGNIYYWTKSQDLASEKDRIAQKSDALLLGQSRDIKQLKKQLNNRQMY